MTETAGPIDPELVLRHTDWVLRLARSLAGGEADDLAQDTWVAALASSAPPRGSVRGWLRAIARNVHARRASRAAARLDVEASGARPEALPAMEALLSRAELQRRVLHEVMGLAEPYRSTVLLRYFEGLSVEALSRRMDVPASTGRTRLQRAHARLRRRLDAEYGGRHTWALVPALAMRHGFAGPTIMETLLMTTKTKLAVAALVAAGGTAAVWTLARPRSEGEETLAAPAGAGAADEIEEALSVSEADEQDRVPQRTVAQPADVQTEEKQPALDLAVEPPAPSARDLWLRVEDTTASMLDGSVWLDDIVSITEGLLADVTPADSYWSEDGTLAYDLLEDPELGKASLHVNPGLAGKPGEFQLRVRLQSAPGFLYPEDATGSDLTLHFGFDEERGNSCTALVHTDFTYDRATNERHMGGGSVVIGGFLKVDREHSTWAPETADTQPDPEHGVRRLHTFGDERDVHAGDLASPKMEAFGTKLRSLRLERR